jgi:hypothetical protein
MAQTQVMYCNNPVNLTSFGELYFGNLTTKDLAFSKFSAFGSFSYPVMPLLNVTISAMYFPDMKGSFVSPSMDYSLAENVDFSLIWQHFESRMNSISTRINMGFLRIKYSF